MGDIMKKVYNMYHGYAKGWWYPGRPSLWFTPGVRVPPSPHNRNVDLWVQEFEMKFADLLSAIHDSQELG